MKKGIEVLNSAVLLEEFFVCQQVRKDEQPVVGDLVVVLYHQAHHGHDHIRLHHVPLGLSMG